MEAFRTIGDILTYIEESYSSPSALNYQQGDDWISFSTEKFLLSVKYVALGLHALGLKRGEKVGILAHPSPYWTIADFAIIAAGGVNVPIFANISEENFLFEVNQTKLQILFIEGDEQWELYNKHTAHFRNVIALEGPVQSKQGMTLEDLMDIGYKEDVAHPELYGQLLSQLKPDDIATIIYTSGSTGVPKGVQLSHRNINCVLNFSEFHWDNQQDSYLSILPLAHIFGYGISHWMLLWGVSVYYTNDYKNLGNIAKQIKPTAMVVVPRLLEKVYFKMIDQLHQTKGLKRIIGEFAFKMARNEKPGFFTRRFLPLFDRLVYRKLRVALGGKVRVVICGGAPLNPHLEHFFKVIGIPIYEGWGLTEACPVCVNYPGKSKNGTVGIPLPNQKLKLTESGEVLVHGDLVMKGYFESPELSKQTVDSEGWLHTGDRGKIDNEGFLTILGRVKELYKTSTGEYVAPVPIEQALCRNPLIEMAMVVAEGKKFTSCLLFPNLEAIQRIKVKKKAQTVSDEEFLKSDYVRTEINNLLKEVNRHLNHWEQIQAYRFVLDPLSIQKGEMTPSMKIRREVVAKKYSALIDSMYPMEGE